MNQFTPHMQARLKKWKDTAAGWIHSDEDASTESTSVELEPEYYEKCKQIADSERTTVTAVVHYMLEQQFSLRSHRNVLEINPELIESNPLLALDALTGHRDRTESEVADIEQF